MDIERIVNNLRAERERLQGIIVALERLHGQRSTTTGAAPKRRGRKFMDKQGRTEVSERMKRYWASRRTETAESDREERADSAAASGESLEGQDRPNASDATRVIAA